MQLNVVLHPTDFSESASHALRLAVHLATSHEARLLIFHATTLHGEHLDAESGMLEPYTQTARELMEKDLPGFASRIAASEGRAVLPFDGIMEATSERVVVRCDSRTRVVRAGRVYGRSGLRLRRLRDATTRPAAEHVPAALDPDSTPHALMS